MIGMGQTIVNDLISENILRNFLSAWGSNAQPPMCRCQSLVGSSLLFSMACEDRASKLSLLPSRWPSRQCAAFQWEM